MLAIILKRGIKDEIETKLISASLVLSFLLSFTASGIQAQAASNGWIQNTGKWYYYENNNMKKGWLLSSGHWYYLNDNGIMTTGWVYTGGHWYYLHNGGDMATGWVNDNGTWYFLEKSGVMTTGWLYTGGNWYYLRNNGAMVTGWIEDGGNKYFLTSSGAWDSSKKPEQQKIYTGNEVQQKLYGLGFTNYNSGLKYNPYGANGDNAYNYASFKVNSGDVDMSMMIYASDADFDQKLKTAFSYILPLSGDKLYTILDNPNVGSQSINLDGRTISINVYSYGISLKFSPIIK